jgi:AcrR family transcriptional regulator
MDGFQAPFRAEQSRAEQGTGKRAATKAQNRSIILAAAHDVFAELGYDVTTVRDIIRRTPLASGTFYNYYPDKESIFRAVVEESMRHARERLRRERRAARTSSTRILSEASRTKRSPSVMLMAIEMSCLSGEMATCVESIRNSRKPRLR